MKKHNVKRTGDNFSPEEIVAVWNKRFQAPMPSLDWGRDACGHLIRFSDYGNISSVFGWEIDHILAVANGGDDQLYNLQPLQWRQNRVKGDLLHSAYCVAVS